MKAVIWPKYGAPDVLELREVEKPVPKDNEILVKIHAATVTAGDCEMRNLKFPFPLSFLMRIYLGLIKPKRATILGQELAGEIESVGKDVTKFEVGDRVFGSTGMSFGAYAEYMCQPEVPKNDADGLFLLCPTGMTYEEAATIPTGGLEALNYLRRANIKKGQKVLINGAGGSIGTYGVQLAKYFGAEVTGVDTCSKLDMLRSIGADHVFDYTKEDFAESGEIYDVILDVVCKRPFSHSIESLAKGGIYLLLNPRISQMIRGKQDSKKSGKTVIAGGVNHTIEDLAFLKELVEKGKLKSINRQKIPSGTGCPGP